MSSPDGKPCRDCGETKPLTEFPKQPGGRWGRHPLCKPCRAAQERERYWRDRDRVRERARAHPRRRERHQQAKLRRYGLTPETFEAMLRRQRGACAICGEEMDPPVIDHDHGSGAIRGLLCSGCNIGLGLLSDDPELCEAAADYLDRRR